MNSTEKWIVVLIAGILSMSIYSALVDVPARNARRDAYLVAHRCRVEGYAGKNATPFYRCDNGLTRREDIK